MLRIRGCLVVCLLMTNVQSLAAQRQKGSRPRGIPTEARAEANKLVGTYFKKCGDSHYVVVNRDLYEWKGFRFDLMPSKLSAADRLNGIEYSGIVRFWSDARRLWSYSNGQFRWGEWWKGEPIPLAIALTKKNGQWSSGKGSAGGLFNFDWTKGQTAPEIFTICPSLEEKPARIPALTRESAMNALKLAYPPPTAKLKIGSDFSLAIPFEGDLKGFILPRLNQYGLTLKNLHKTSCCFRVDAFEPQESWKPYLVDESTRTYALAERVNYELGDLQYVSDDNFKAQVSVTYLGCTPICGLIEELDWPRYSWFLGDPYPKAAGSVPDASMRRSVWGQTVSREMHFRWDYSTKSWPGDSQPKSP